MGVTTETTKLLQNPVYASAQVDVDRDIRMHDFFNMMLALPLQCAFTALSMTAGMHLPCCLYWLLYIAVDTMWVFWKPHCVKSARTILFHHVLGLYLGIHVTTYVSHRRFCSSLTLIELNTIFLIGRRYVQHWLWNVGFYTSWIAIRVIYVPVITAHTLLTLDDWPPGFWGSMLMFSIYIPFVAMNVIQLNWSLQLAKRFFRPDKHAPAMANGSDGRPKAHFL